jgi:hypothetical protein
MTRSKSRTIPEVFVIESCHDDDKEAGRSVGKRLYTPNLPKALKGLCQV